MVHAKGEKQSRVGGCAGDEVCCFNRVLREGITDAVISGERPEDCEEASDNRYPE